MLRLLFFMTIVDTILILTLIVIKSGLDSKRWVIDYVLEILVFLLLVIATATAVVLFVDSINSLIDHLHGRELHEPILQYNIHNSTS